MLSHSSISVKFVENGGFSQIPEVYSEWNCDCLAICFTVYIEESTYSSESFPVFRGGNYKIIWSFLWKSEGSTCPTLFLPLLDRQTVNKFLFSAFPLEKYLKFLSVHLYFYLSWTGRQSVISIPVSLVNIICSSLKYGFRVILARLCFKYDYASINNIVSGQLGGISDRLHQAGMPWYYIRGIPKLAPKLHFQSTAFCTWAI